MTNPLPIFRTVFLMSNAFVAPWFSDEIEINRCCHANGETRFQQVIAWGSHPTTSLQHVQAWWLAEPGDRIVETPNGVSLIRTNIDDKPAVVRAGRVRWTETLNDPECDDREIVPEGERTGLW